MHARRAATPTVLFAIAAAGEAGLGRLVELLKRETNVTLAQIGARSLAEVGSLNLVETDSPPAAEARARRAPA